MLKVCCDIDKFVATMILKNQLKVCRDNGKFVATIIQSECQATVLRQSHNNTKDIQHCNFVTTMIDFVLKNTLRAFWKAIAAIVATMPQQILKTKTDATMSQHFYYCCENIPS